MKIFLILSCLICLTFFLFLFYQQCHSSIKRGEYGPSGSCRRQCCCFASRSWWCDRVSFILNSFFFITFWLQYLFCVYSCYAGNNYLILMMSFYVYFIIYQQWAEYQKSFGLSRNCEGYFNWKYCLQRQITKSGFDSWHSTKSWVRIF